MKILSVFSGPRKNKNTHTLLKNFLNGFISQKKDTEIFDIFLPDKNIEFCQGCLACKTKLDTCYKKDDMVELREKFKQSDVIVLATPVYWFNMTAQMKIFIDRLFALKAEDFAGKKIVLIVTFEDVDINCSGAYNIINSLTDICNYLKMDLCVKLCISTCELQIEDNKQALTEAFEKGADLAKKL